MVQKSCFTKSRGQNRLKDFQGRVCEVNLNCVCVQAVCASGHLVYSQMLHLFFTYI